MLKGEDIHAAFKEFDPDFAFEWECVSAKGRSAYDAVAEQLNKIHIQPLRDDLEAERKTVVALMHSIATLQANKDMLTGKDIYEVARPYLEQLGLECSDWETGDFGQGTWEFYNALAERLNTEYFVPLQGQAQSCLQSEKTTLLDAMTVINDLNGQIYKLTDDMKALRDLDRSIFDKQNEELTALKTLVRNFKALIDDDELIIEDCADGWYAKKEQTFALARRLLQED